MAYCQQCSELLKEVEKLKARLSEVQSTSLLASLRELAEKWRTERDFLATGESGDRASAKQYDECACELLEIVKANTSGKPEGATK